MNYCNYKEWMESQYPVLAEAIKTTHTVDSFHLAEENKQEFPHDYVRFKSPFVIKYIMCYLSHV